ncbi:MAG: hypothetical protein ACYTF1_19995 [Planctomycetota bacterium]|jgi:hypothetical protein
MKRASVFVLVLFMARSNVCASEKPAISSLFKVTPVKQAKLHSIVYNSPAATKHQAEFARFMNDMYCVQTLAKPASQETPPAGTNLDWLLYQSDKSK